jgi:hypothetical protein
MATAKCSLPLFLHVLVGASGDCAGARSGRAKRRTGGSKVRREKRGDAVAAAFLWEHDLRKRTQHPRRRLWAWLVIEAGRRDLPYGEFQSENGQQF